MQASGSAQQIALTVLPRVAGVAHTRALARARIGPQPGGVHIHAPLCERSARPNARAMATAAPVAIEDGLCTLSATPPVEALAHAVDARPVAVAIDRASKHRSLAADPTKSGHAPRWVEAGQRLASERAGEDGAVGVRLVACRWSAYSQRPVPRHCPRPEQPYGQGVPPDPRSVPSSVTCATAAATRASRLPEEKAQAGGARPS